MAGRAKENLPGGSLKYLFVYLKIRVFKCSYRIYLYIEKERERERETAKGCEPRILFWWHIQVELLVLSAVKNQMWTMLSAG